MATANGVMKLRDADNSTSVGTLVIAFNNMHDLIVASGMMQVADDEYAGQAKTFSSTAGVGLTQVVKDVTTAKDVVMGYKVYKHPTLMLYVLVNFCDVVTRAPTTPSSFVRFTYQLSSGLLGGGFHPSKMSSLIQSTDILISIVSSGNHSLTHLTDANLPITVSCGSDHFWICRKQGVLVNQRSNSSGSFPFDRIDVSPIGVFASQKNNSVFCVITPPSLSSSLTAAGYSGESQVLANSPHCMRYQTHVNGVWSKRDNGAAGSLQDASISNTEDGIRVAQAELVIAGEQHRFNFGFINATVLPEFEVVSLNLNGLTQRYQALPNLGSAGHAAPYMLPNAMSIPLFPLVD